jgi:hypothetical protein
MEKKLGKIESISFGLGGYQGAMLGLHVTLGNSGSQTHKSGNEHPFL